MKKIYFYTYWEPECTNSDNPYAELLRYEPGELSYSDYFSSFDEACKDRESCRFPASPVIEGWIKGNKDVNKGV